MSGYATQNLSRQKERVPTYELFRSINSVPNVQSDQQIEPTRLAHFAPDLQDVRPVVLCAEAGNY